MGNSTGNILVILVVIILVFAGVSGCGPRKDYAEFAKCLSAANMSMYGASWCPHCKAVKSDFGLAFRFINYTECDENTIGAEPEKCAAANIEYLPTFIFADGGRLFGEVSFSILSEKTKCALP